MHVEAPSLMLHRTTLGKLRNGANVILFQSLYEAVRDWKPLLFLMVHMQYIK
jgi:hypothetical protein